MKSWKFIEEINPAKVPRIGAANPHANIKFDNNFENNSKLINQGLLYSPKTEKNNSGNKPRSKNSHANIVNINDLQIENNVPQRLNKIYDNSMESSVVSSKSGATPRALKHTLPHKENNKDIMIKEKLEIVAESGTNFK